MNKDSYGNLNKSTKWLGIIDYKLLIIFLLIMFLVWNFLGLFNVSDLMRMYIVIIISIPFIGIVYANRAEDNISDVIYCVFKYVISPKLYVYRIETRKDWLK